MRCVQANTYDCAQVTCVNVRSYGLVTIPSSLPASLESMWVGTKARGRRIGPSLLMPKASDMPNVRVRPRALQKRCLRAPPCAW